MGSRKRVGKVHKVMAEWKDHKLHSGSKTGPLVTSKPQALAIALSEAGMAKKPRKKRRNQTRGY